MKKGYLVQYIGIDIAEHPTVKTLYVGTNYNDAYQIFNKRLLKIEQELKEYYEDSETPKDEIDLEDYGVIDEANASDSHWWSFTNHDGDTEKIMHLEDIVINDR